MKSHHRALLTVGLLLPTILLPLSAQDEGEVVQPELPPTVVEDAPPVSEDAPLIVEDGYTIVDVMILYTPAARANAGSATAMRAAIQAYVATANRCYSNSDIDVRMRLVGTAEVSYTESTSSMSTDLSWVANNATVAAMRTARGADIVTLIRRGGVGGAAGVGYLGNVSSGFASSAFNVVADDWADTNLSFPHEVGHNFGCHHDHNNGSGASRAFAYGHRFTPSNGIEYRTVMAYAPGTRIAYFSNPSISYLGTATGVSGTGATAADNALMHETSAGVTAAFRNRATATLTEFTGDTKSDIIFFANDGRIATWPMNGATVAPVQLLGSTFNLALWRPLATGDFNGDGKSDLIFFATDGRIAIWFQNGLNRTSAATLATTFNPAIWTPYTTGDLNGDGKSDILFKAADGRIAVWFMNGSTRTSAATTSVAYNTSVWTPGPTADLNDDGKADLLFTAADGRIAVWYMDGGTRTSAGTLALTYNPSIWTLTATGDYDGSGSTDLLFKAADGRMALWFMVGAERSSAANTSATLSGGWTVF